MGEIVNIDKDRYHVYEYFWGVAILDSRENKWLKVQIGEQELNLSDKNVIAHENGVEFVKEG